MTVFTYQESVVDLVTSVKKSLKTFLLNPFISLPSSLSLFGIFLLRIPLSKFKSRVSVGFNFC